MEASEETGAGDAGSVWTPEQKRAIKRYLWKYRVEGQELPPAYASIGTAFGHAVNLDDELRCFRDAWIAFLKANGTNLHVIELRLELTRFPNGSRLLKILDALKKDDDRLWLAVIRSVYGQDQDVDPRVLSNALIFDDKRNHSCQLIDGSLKDDFTDYITFFKKQFEELEKEIKAVGGAPSRISVAHEDPADDENTSPLRSETGGLAELWPDDAYYAVFQELRKRIIAGYNVPVAYESLASVWAYRGVRDPWLTPFLRFCRMQNDPLDPALTDLRMLLQYPESSYTWAVKELVKDNYRRLRFILDGLGHNVDGKTREAAATEIKNTSGLPERIAAQLDKEVFERRFKDYVAWFVDNITARVRENFHFQRDFDKRQQRQGEQAETGNRPPAPVPPETSPKAQQNTDPGRSAKGQYLDDPPGDGTAADQFALQEMESRALRFDPGQVTVSLNVGGEHVQLTFKDFEDQIKSKATRSVQIDLPQFCLEEMYASRNVRARQREGFTILYTPASGLLTIDIALSHDGPGAVRDFLVTLMETRLRKPVAAARGTQGRIDKSGGKSGRNTPLSSSKKGGSPIGSIKSSLRESRKKETIKEDRGGVIRITSRPRSGSTPAASSSLTKSGLSKSKKSKDKKPRNWDNLLVSVGYKADNGEEELYRQAVPFKDLHDKLSGSESQPHLHRIATEAFEGGHTGEWEHDSEMWVGVTNDHHFYCVVNLTYEAERRVDKKYVALRQVLLGYDYLSSSSHSEQGDPSTTESGNLSTIESDGLSDAESDDWGSPGSDWGALASKTWFDNQGLDYPIAAQCMPVTLGVNGVFSIPYMNINFFLNQLKEYFPTAREGFESELIAWLGGKSQTYAYDTEIFMSQAYSNQVLMLHINVTLSDGESKTELGKGLVRLHNSSL